MLDENNACDCKIEEQTNNSPNRNKLVQTVFDYVEIFAICVCVVFLIFSFAARVCTVNGHSMDNTLKHGEVLIVSNLFYKPSQGDIVVFHQTDDTEGGFNEPIVKRIIATEGQTVTINFNTGEVFVDGEILDEEYAYLDTGRYEKAYWAKYDMNYSTSIFESVVPEGKIFVMGDNRNHSADSRSERIGMVDQRRLLGRVIFRLSPFGTVK